MEAERFNSLLRLMDIGDESVIEILQREYGKQIKWVAYSVLNDWHYAKDVLNEVLTTLWNKSKRFNNIENPNACIYNLAKKASYTFYRKYLKKHKFEIRLDNVSKKDAQRHLIHIDNHSTINFYEFISELNETEKEIIVKKLIFYYTHAQIAKELGIPEGTIKWKYQLILEKLHKKLTNENNSC